MRRHDLLFLLACCAAAAHLLWTMRSAELREREKHLVAQEELRPEQLKRMQKKVRQDLRELAQQPGSGLAVYALHGLRRDDLSYCGGSGRLPQVESELDGAQFSCQYWSSSPLPADSRAALLALDRALPPETEEPQPTARPMKLQTKPSWRSSMLASWRESGGVSIGIFPQQRSVQSLSPPLDRVWSSRVYGPLPGLTYATAERSLQMLSLYMSERPPGSELLWVELQDLTAPWIPWRDHLTLPEDFEAWSLGLPGGKKQGWRRWQRRVSQGERPPAAVIDTWEAAREAEFRRLDETLAPSIRQMRERGLRILIIGLNGQGYGEDTLLGQGEGVSWEETACPLVLWEPEGATESQLEGPLDSEAVQQWIAWWLQTGERPQPAAAARSRGGASSQGSQALRTEATSILLRDDGEPAVYALSEDPKEEAALRPSPEREALLEQWLPLLEPQPVSEEAGP